MAPGCGLLLGQSADFHLAIDRWTVSAASPSPRASVRGPQPSRGLLGLGHGFISPRECERQIKTPARRRPERASSSPQDWSTQRLGPPPSVLRGDLRRMSLLGLPEDPY